MTKFKKGDYIFTNYKNDNRRYVVGKIIKSKKSKLNDSLYVYDYIVIKSNMEDKGSKSGFDSKSNWCSYTKKISKDEAFLKSL
jgi:hypothetical protein